MNNKKLLYTLLLGATLTSCAEVEICERDHPHQGDVNFTYTWNKPEDKPNRMGVLCYRVVGQWKQVAEVNTDDLTLRLIGETTITPENRPNENPDEGDNTGGDNTGGDNTGGDNTLLSLFTVLRTSELQLLSYLGLTVVQSISTTTAIRTTASTQSLL